MAVESEFRLVMGRLRVLIIPCHARGFAVKTPYVSELYDGETQVPSESRRHASRS
jgi:hypothetical protein